MIEKQQLNQKYEHSINLIDFWLAQVDFHRTKNRF